MAVVTTGFFDGVHLGHRLILSRLVAEGRARNCPSVVVTFWPHPRTVLQQDARQLRLLTSLDEKVSLVRSLGVDRVEVLDFTKEFASMTAVQYLGMLRQRFGADIVLMGYDNRIGCDRLTADQIPSDPALPEILPLEELDPSMHVSSTLVRQTLQNGDVESARRLLGRDYMLKGVVVAGNRLGRTIGFPTANMLLYEPLKLIPSSGVYAVGLQVLGRQFDGMCNIGTRPTVGASNALTIETNIFDFNEDIYGLDISVFFRKKLRPELKFSSLTELQAQLVKDRQNVLSLL